MKYFNLIILFLTTSCFYDDDFKRHQSKKSAPIQIQEEAPRGPYLAVLKNINPSISKKLSAALTFFKDPLSDELLLHVRVSFSEPHLIHRQTIRAGSRCPDQRDDLNHDGLIDGKEAELVYGKILIPVDGDLSSQLGHDGEYPTTDEFGRYQYSNHTNYEFLIADLTSDSNHSDYVKLTSKEELKIQERVFVLQGLPQEIELPTTVHGETPLSPHHSFPLACGTIRAVL